MNSPGLLFFFLAMYAVCVMLMVLSRRHGDLTSTDSALHQPLHSFSLDTRGQTMEFELPERLDLGISETGIVGRQVTLLSRNVLLGTGIVGWN